MTDTIVLSLNNSNCTVTNNNKFVYTLPVPYSANKGVEVCLASGYIYNSLFNVNKSVFNNSEFNLVFPSLAGNVTINFDMPNGFYDIDSGINGYIQKICKDNKLYLLDANLAEVYYISVNTNAIYYTTTITSTPVPTALPTGYTFPSGGWNNIGSNLPAVTSTPQFVVLSNNFGSLIGYTAGTYPAVMQTTLYNVNGTITPKISPQYVFNVNSNLVNNQLISTNPSSIFQFTFKVGFGFQQEIAPYNYLWYTLQPNQYNQIVLYITDQSNQPVLLNDSNTQFTLMIRTKRTLEI